MDTATEKELKEHLNEVKQSSDEKQSDEGVDTEEIKYIGDIDGDRSSQKSLKQIQEIFQKTEAMKLVAKEKNQELEDQFKVLKQRLNSSSEYLSKIKSNIENIKFSYQKNVIDLQKRLDAPTEAAKLTSEAKEGMGMYMEELRRKIDQLQTKMSTQREKQQHVTESYEEAFDKVIDTLQRINSGAYSSVNILGNGDNAGDPTNNSTCE